MRTLIEELDREFAAAEDRLRAIIDATPEAKLFEKPFADEKTLIELSVGGSVIRSAAMIEQAFLGITRRLWDDPFEWTLPENLSNKPAIVGYIDEVSITRSKGMAFLTSDADLTRQLLAPEKLKSIFTVLIDALQNAQNYIGRAEVISLAVVRKTRNQAGI